MSEPDYLTEPTPWSRHEPACPLSSPEGHKAGANVECQCDELRAARGPELIGDVPDGPPRLPHPDDPPTVESETARVAELADRFGIDLPTDEQMPLGDVPEVARPAARLWAVLVSVAARVAPHADGAMSLADARHANLLRVLVEANLLTQAEVTDIELGAIQASTDQLIDLISNSVQRARAEAVEHGGQTPSGLHVAKGAVPPPDAKPAPNRAARRHPKRT